MSFSPNSSSSSDIHAPEYRPYHDVLCNVEVVLGTGSISVRECLKLKPRTVLRLAQASGSDLQVLVNGIAIAAGEVVILDDSTAVRITEISQPSNTGDAQP